MTTGKNPSARQQQFLNVIRRDEATQRFQSALNLSPVAPEKISIYESLNRVLADNIVAEIDVTPFDRANMDGFAVRAEDTIGATEDAPVELSLSDEVIVPGRVSGTDLQAGSAISIATGAVIPRGANAVVMIEDTQCDEHSGNVRIQRSVAAGQNVSFAGSDIASGETVLRAGQVLSSREIGVLAAIGCATVSVVGRPRVAIISTGDEICPPGEPLEPGKIYDSNAAILGAAVTELGGVPEFPGTVRDDLNELRQKISEARECDVIVLSGGTSKGAGDLSYRVVSELNDPGIVAHGVALKPGKPVCLAASNGRPIVVLPGFPTSAVFTFHEFVAPVIARLAGRQLSDYPTVAATLPMKVHSQRGRAEFLLVSLIRTDDADNSQEESQRADSVDSTAHNSGRDGSSRDQFAAYPIGKGSGSVTTFSRADGFITMDEHTEIVDAGAAVRVRLLSSHLEPADLVFMGSHCVGLDLLVNELHARGLRCRIINVGSMGGLTAATRGECDVAGIHLLDAKTNVYNRPFLNSNVTLVDGYQREQGFVYRADDTRFCERFDQTDTADRAVAFLEFVQQADLKMVNRNAGSGTRVLLDQLLNGQKPDGYFSQPRSHNAVAAAVAQNRVDWGLTIKTIARRYNLGFIPVRCEHYDFVIPVKRKTRPAVSEFCKLLNESAMQEKLLAAGFSFSKAKA